MSDSQVPPRPERPNGQEEPSQRAQLLWDFMDRIDRKFDRVHARIDRQLYLLLGILGSVIVGLATGLGVVIMQMAD